VRIDDWWFRYRDIIPDFERFLDALRRPPPVYVRTNPRRTSAPALRARLAARGARLEPAPIPGAFLAAGLERPGVTVEFVLGHYYVQGLTSMLPALALSPEPGQKILDLCAAPGSKTTQIADMIEDRGLLVANDVKIPRLRALQSNLERLGVTCSAVTSYRGESFPGRIPFDRVLVDAPCSGEGTWREVPPRRSRDWDPAQCERLRPAQLRLLARAADLVAPGGLLVYSTCTYAPEENEAVVDELLGTRPDLSLEPVSLPVPHAPGLTGWQGRTFRRELAFAARVYPHLVDSWGFFVARLRRA